MPWFYDGFMWLMEATGLGRWRRLLLAGARGRTLEVGCGTGRNLPLYPSEARVLASAEALPFRPGSFDTVVSSLVFCSVGDPRRGLAEVRRVLRPGGLLRMMEHVRARGRLHGRLQDWAQPAWTWVTGGCRPNRDTESEVEAAGFLIDRDGRRASGLMRLFTARPR